MDEPTYKDGFDIGWAGGRLAGIEAERARVLALVDAEIAHPKVGISTLVALRAAIESGSEPEAK